MSVISEANIKANYSPGFRLAMKVFDFIELPACFPGVSRLFICAAAA
jgi:hypothetical protein